VTRQAPATISIRSVRAGAEVVAAGIDEPERFLGAVGHQHGVADDLAVKIDIGLGVNGDAGELGGQGHGGRGEGESDSGGCGSSQPPGASCWRSLKLQDGIADPATVSGLPPVALGLSRRDRSGDLSA